MLLQMALFHSFLWLSSSLLYVYVCIYTHTHHIFFIHSSIDGHLGCFIESGILHGQLLSQVAGVPKVAPLPTFMLNESVHTLHGKGLSGPQGWLSLARGQVPCHHGHWGNI